GIVRAADADAITEITAGVGHRATDECPPAPGDLHVAVYVDRRGVRPLHRIDARWRARRGLQDVLAARARRTAPDAAIGGVPRRPRVETSLERGAGVHRLDVGRLVRGDVSDADHPSAPHDAGEERDA